MDIQAYKKGLLGLMADFDFIDGFILDSQGNLAVMITSYDELSKFGNTVTSYGHAFQKFREAYQRHEGEGAFRCSVMMSSTVPVSVKKAEDTYILRRSGLENLVPKGAKVEYLH